MIQFFNMVLLEHPPNWEDSDVSKPNLHGKRGCSRSSADFHTSPWITGDFPLKSLHVRRLTTPSRRGTRSDDWSWCGRGSTWKPGGAPLGWGSCDARCAQLQVKCCLICKSNTCAIFRFDPISLVLWWFFFFDWKQQRESLFNHDSITVVVNI